SAVINGAERTKRRHGCRVLVDLNKHGVAPSFYFCDHAQLCASNSIRDLNGRSWPIYRIPWCSSVNLPCSTLLGAMHHRYYWSRRVLALSSPVPAYLGSRRNAEPLAMWGSENIGGPCDRNRFIHPTPRPLRRIRAFGRNCRPWYRRCSVTSLAFKRVF